MQIGQHLSLDSKRHQSVFISWYPGLDTKIGALHKIACLAVSLLTVMACQVGVHRNSTRQREREREMKQKQQKEMLNYASFISSIFIWLAMQVYAKHKLTDARHQHKPRLTDRTREEVCSPKTKESFQPPSGKHFILMSAWLMTVETVNRTRQTPRLMRLRVMWDYRAHISRHD